MSKAKTVKEVLTAVEWMLENVGWTQHCAYRNQYGESLEHNYAIEHPNIIGSMCLAGAFSIVEADSSVLTAAKRLFREIIPTPYGIIYFNDAPGLSKKEVISALDRAIKKAK